MSTRFACYAAGSVFAAAVALAVADLWLPAAALMFPLGVLAGRWRLLHRLAVVSAALITVGAELERSRGEVFRLGDELTTYYDRRHAARFADVDRPRTDWAAVDRKPDTAALRVPVSERTTTNP
ncbi:hypothetical protein MED01_002318 [Micromonospora sp. MED01]|uniref:hypothetical protein n=1 Tax=Micromonospora alfalfae TaxID=2911212 RepID=UPI001EE91133|nr:hypothetical protein [Micromonospora alfalfae]MCG5464153.1 hypothetical protein [Micromonospora alfalfae]